MEEDVVMLRARKQGSEAGSRKWKARAERESKRAGEQASSQKARDRESRRVKERESREVRECEIKGGARKERKSKRARAPSKRSRFLGAKVLSELRCP